MYDRFCPAMRYEKLEALPVQVTMNLRRNNIVKLMLDSGDIALVLVVNGRHNRAGMAFQLFQPFALMQQELQRRTDELRAVGKIELFFYFFQQICRFFIQGEAYYPGHAKNLNKTPMVLREMLISFKPKFINTPVSTMRMTLEWIVGATFLVSLISLVGVFLISMKKQHVERILFATIAFAAGTLLGAAFLDLLPEAMELQEAGQTLQFALIGIVMFFLLEKVIHW